MNFFRNFPQLLVSNLTTGRNKRTVVMTDIIRRVAVTEQFKDIAAFLLPYTVQDGETPESVATKVYGNPGYHWVILLINNITNPREEWVKTNRDLLADIYNRYDYLVTVPSADSYAVDDVLEADTGARFVVTFVGPIGGPQRAILMRWVSGSKMLTAANTLTNETQDIADQAIDGIVAPPDVPHHAETADGIVLVTLNQAAWGATYEGVFDEVLVTNYQHEERLNDRRRTIKILDRTYLERFVREFKDEISA